MLVKLPLTQVFIKNIRDFYFYNQLYLVGCVRMNMFIFFRHNILWLKAIEIRLKWWSEVIRWKCQRLTKPYVTFPSKLLCFGGKSSTYIRPHNPLREIWHIVVNVENIVCYLLEGGRGYGHEIILFVSGCWVTKYRFNISILGGTWYSRFDFSLLILRAGLSTNLIWKCRKVPWCLTAPGYQKNNC